MALCQGLRARLNAIGFHNVQHQHCKTVFFFALHKASVFSVWNSVLRNKISPIVFLYQAMQMNANTDRLSSNSGSRTDTGRAYCIVVEVSTTTRRDIDSKKESVLVTWEQRFTVRFIWRSAPYFTVNNVVRTARPGENEGIVRAFIWIRAGRTPSVSQAHCRSRRNS